VERHLGLLAAALGDRAAARRHFARALERNRAIGARLYVARTLHDAASSLDDAQDLAAARAAYAELGIERPAGADPNRARAENVFHRDGDVWTLTFAGRSVTVRDSKGLRDIASLLAHPGRPFPAVELVSGAQMNPETPAREDQLHDQGDLGELIDEKARRAYRLRLGELEEAAADADTAGDVESSARIAVERDALVAQLSAAYGIGGRPRKAGSQVERARTTVTARIRDSIRRVALAHPELGRHLAVAVRTGTVCSYEPEQAVRWQLTP
jgi:tetratricopeptide (TPR) repeat protein